MHVVALKHSSVEGFMELYVKKTFAKVEKQK
jgi:hypothetical protein